MAANAFSAANVLVVEDDPAVATAIGLCLEKAGFEVVTAADGRSAMEAIDALPIDLVTLDLGLPGVDGHVLCRAIRAKSPVPIIMVTARAGASDVVEGLEEGADDYLTKPFDPPVLVARVRAVLRRCGDEVPRVRSCRDLVIDELEFVARQRGTALALTPIELRLLAELVRRADVALSREHLLEEVWGYGYLGDSRLVDMAVRRLRAKLGEADDGQPYISTVRGVGYRFEGGGVEVEP